MTLLELVLEGRETRDGSESGGKLLSQALGEIAVVSCRRVGRVVAREMSSGGFDAYVSNSSVERRPEGYSLLDFRLSSLELIDEFLLPRLRFGLGEL